MMGAIMARRPGIGGGQEFEDTSFWTTVLEGDFDTDYETALPWDFVNNSFNEETMSVSFHEMLGHNSIRVTWEDGALPSHRFGGFIDLPGANIGDHARFTHHIKFSDPFSPGTSEYGGKLPGLGGVLSPVGCVANNCADGWSGRHMFRGNKSVYSGSDILPAEQYLYWPHKQNLCGDRFAFSTGFELNTPHVYVQEVKINSAYNSTDGYVKTWLDDVLVAETLNMQFYCDTNDNRQYALIGKLLFLDFWGGDDEDWSPSVQSWIEHGYIKVEVPATSPGPGPVIISLDTFTEASATDLTAHEPDNGTGWTEEINSSSKKGVIDADGDFLKTDGAENNVRLVYSLQPNPSVAEYDVEIDVIAERVGSALTPFGLIARFSNAGSVTTYYLAKTNTGGNDIFLYKIVAGTYTLLDQADTDAEAPYTLKFEIRNATKKVYLDDVEILSSDDNVITAPGKVGVFWGDLHNPGNTTISDQWELDNFTVSEP